MTDVPTQSLGVLELSGRQGFLRRRERSWDAAPDDIRVEERMVRDAGLRPGDEVSGEVRQQGRNRSPVLTRVTAVNGLSPDEARRRPDFARLPAVHPARPLRLSGAPGVDPRDDMIGRVIDLFNPLGFGQRALVVAPAKAGKTTVLQAIARGIAAAAPQSRIYLLLVDERPEEVFEMEQTGVGEVVASSFDFGAARHVAVAELTLERARRRVEQGEDAVIIMDSLTRLARAYNSSERGSGRTLSGGMDATSLAGPKRFLGSAREVDPARGKGSLTIIATALVDTGSKMDQVIYEEFKGTGNSELMLSRELAERRLYPAIDLRSSGTRREELLLDPETLEGVRQLRAGMAALPAADAMQRLLVELRRTASNSELIRSLARTPE